MDITGKCRFYIYEVLKILLLPQFIKVDHFFFGGAFLPGPFGPPGVAGSCSGFGSLYGFQNGSLGPGIVSGIVIGGRVDGLGGAIAIIGDDFD